MKMMMRLIPVMLITLMAWGCGSKDVTSSGKVSTTTGWDYNNPENGGFEVTTQVEQETGPGLIFIEGGTFVMGSTQERVIQDWDNNPRKVTVPSFYMDETEVSNLDYLEYLYWLNRVFGEDYPEIYRDALPDSLAWRQQLAYNEPLVETYFRHPSYHNYPVVGVNWEQAKAFCVWRTNMFNSYLSSKGQAGLNDFRLPTEAEWEYAALGLIGNTLYNRVVERREYPWNGSGVRTDERKYYGSFVANFKRGNGDYMGVAGNLNDGAALPAPVISYWPNDYGLYNMAGNVSEWTEDVYRPLSHLDVADMNPFRGNVFKNVKKDIDGRIAEKDSLGHIQYVPITDEEAATRKNYRTANNINYKEYVPR